MIAKCICAIVLLGAFAAEVTAQSRSDVRTHGNVQLLEVSSAEIPDILQMVQKRISLLGFADKWEMPAEVLGQDIVIARDIVFERGRRLLLAPKTMNDRNIILFVARTIQFSGPPGAPVQLVWDKNTRGQMREPLKLPKAAGGVPGDREGADGKSGVDGVSGSRGPSGQDAPTVVLVTERFVQNDAILFQLEGQDGGPGAPGQDGGDGGAGRSGRAGMLIANAIGLNFKRESPCEPPVRSGNGGRGGAGGRGGLGGPGGDGGAIALISLDVDALRAMNLVHVGSKLSGGKGGQRGPRGLGGKGGALGAGVPATAPCQDAAAGSEGPAGDGRPADRADPDTGAPGTQGQSGIAIFSKLSESQAKSIGLSDK